MLLILLRLPSWPYRRGRVFGGRGGDGFSGDFPLVLDGGQGDLGGGSGSAAGCGGVAGGHVRICVKSALPDDTTGAFGGPWGYQSGGRLGCFGQHFASYQT
jgi:hypothetical protein